MHLENNKQARLLKCQEELRRYVSSTLEHIVESYLVWFGFLQKSKTKQNKNKYDKVECVTGKAFPIK